MANPSFPLGTNLGSSLNGANPPTVWADLVDDSGLVIDGHFTGTPPTTANMFQIGCLMLATDTGNRYINVGSSTTPSFVVGSAANAMQTVSLTAAQIIATTAGSLSSANGLIVVPAAPAGFVNVFQRGIVSYTFATAAFTGGGNTTFNIGGGGAALSGLIATTSLWQSATSVIYQFNPLSTVANAITTATSINLVTASAITNPGTAAGSAKVYVWYSQVAI